MTSSISNTSTAFPSASCVCTYVLCVTTTVYHSHEGEEEGGEREIEGEAGEGEGDVVVARTLCGSSTRRSKSSGSSTWSCGHLITQKVATDTVHLI